MYFVGRNQPVYSLESCRLSDWRTHFLWYCVTDSEYGRPSRDSSQASRCFDLLVVPKSGNFYLTDCFCDVFGEELAIWNIFFQSNGTCYPGDKWKPAKIYRMNIVNAKKCKLTCLFVTNSLLLLSFLSSKHLNECLLNTYFTLSYNSTSEFPTLWCACSLKKVPLSGGACPHILLSEDPRDKTFPCSKAFSRMIFSILF